MQRHYNSQLAQAIAAAVPALPPLQPQPENVAKCRGLSRESRRYETNPNPQALTLKPRQHSAITLLFAGHSVASAARTLDINPRTIFRWLSQPQFRAAMKDQTPQLHLPPSRVMEKQAQAYDRAVAYLIQSQKMSRNVAVFQNPRNEPKPIAPSTAGQSAAVLRAAPPRAVALPRPDPQILKPTLPPLNSSPPKL
jgi:transposase-like protein